MDESLEPTNPKGEFHHFQLVDAEGRIPVSISVLVHYNPVDRDEDEAAKKPITDQEIIDFHYALKEFNGDYLQAFSRSNS